MIPFMTANIPKLVEVKENIEEIFGTAKVTTDKYTTLFENRVKEITNAEYAVAYANNTSALIIALAYLKSRNNIKTVSLPAFEWASVKRVCDWLDLRAKWIDINPETFNIEKYEKSDCIICNHAFGNKCIVPESDMPMIFDAAHALGTKGVGINGLCEIFSFTPHKIFCSFEGGMLTTNDKDLYNYAYKMRRHFARMPEINAVIGLFNTTKKFKILLKRHEEIWKHYKSHLPFKFQKITSSNFSHTACLVENRNELFKIEGDKAIISDVECRLRYDPEDIHLPDTDYVWNRIVCLPTHEKVDEKLVAEKIKEGVKK
jgi:dTDP-4-amino-4,6-dideoxygalactose transaminase